MRRAFETEKEKSFAVLESVTDAFYALDRNFRFAFINARAERYFGIKREELIGRNAFETFPAGYGTQFQTEFEKAFRENVPVEFELLLSLARAKGRVKTRDHLLEEIRDRDYEVFDRSIDVHISALRKKLGDDPKTPRFIRTVRAAGYLLIDPDAEFP
jgi:PAS domain S-box-containing protein